MRSFLWTALALTAAAATAPAAQAQGRDDPGIRVWINHREVMRADKVRAYVRTQDDGYVVVLHAEPSGRVRVLFPVDPTDDDYVRGGRDYEIRGRGDREAFAVYQADGSGYVYAAVARDPFQFDGLVLNGHWDYRAPDFAVGDDPEADLTALVQKIAGGTFEYDVTRYDVGYDAAASLSLYDPYYGGHAWYGHSAFSINFGIGIGPGPFWYDPWWDPWYGPWYDPWYNPWFGWPGYWSGWGYGGWYGPYYPYTRYVYGPRYGPGYFGGGGYYGGRYAFKSPDDRWGLQPRAVGPRQRTPTARTVLAGGTTGVLWNGEFGRRTVTNTRTSVGDRSAAIGRRVAPQPVRDGTPGANVVGPGRRVAPQGTSPTRDGAAGASVVGPGRRVAPQGTQSPTRDGAAGANVAGPGRRVAPAQPQRPSGDGSTDLGRVGPSRRATPAPQSGARPTAPQPAARPAPRGLRIANDAPEPRSTARAPVSGSERRTMQPVERSGVQPVGPGSQRAPTRSAAPSSGRSTSGGTPSLSRRSGPAPSTVSPPRVSSPPRSSAPRASPAPRTSAPRASPPARSAPPARSSPPSGGGRRRG